MKPVFGDKVNMFTMNKVLATNMFKIEEVAQPATTQDGVKDEAKQEPNGV